VRHGLTNREIAERQGVSSDAVKYHVANVLSKLAIPSRAELRRWNGVRGDSNLSKQGVGGVGQVARSVGNIEAARDWYGNVLGLRHLYSFGDLAFFDCAGLRLFLSEGDAAPESILYFLVGDIHAAQKQMQDRGVEFTHAPHMVHRHDDGTEEWMAFFKDNEGRPLALMTRIPPAGKLSTV
jgi:catechol 2,3-dioxygenase-like lactoylglutathione lyase family enzyme